MKMSSSAERALSHLREQGLTLATAESCTGGLIGKLLTDVPGASQVYKGGVISYTNEVKHALLGVEQETLDVCTAVSRETAHEMARGARERCGADCVIMPCNTAHYFLPRLQAMTSLPFLSMLEATAKTCAKDFPGQTAAILATKGTLATGLYEKALNAQGVHCLVPDEGEQDVLMHLIYDVVKASKPLEPEQGAWQALLDGLRARGADYFILGCTELPIIADTLPQPGPFVDPTAELAKAAIRICGYKVKGE